jgi:integrase
LAGFHGPDGVDRPAPKTFATRGDAERWLGRTEDDILGGDWIDPDAGRVLLRNYAEPWVTERAGLSPKTRQLYEGLVRLHIVPTLGNYSVRDISPARVRRWRSALLAAGIGPVTVAKAYRLLRTILGTAVDDRLIRANPCQIRGASVERSPERPVLTIPEVFAVAEAMPASFRMLVLLATFCSMRWGELAALTRADVDVRRGIIRIRRSLSEMKDGSLIIGLPKTEAGTRPIAIPRVLRRDLRRHLEDYVQAGPTALVFTGPKGAPLRRSNFQKHWRAALTKAGVSAVHFHDLRHTGNTLTAESGAALRELMTRMGHSSPRAALIYLHTSSTRDRAVADALDKLVKQEQKKAGKRSRRDRKQSPPDTATGT